MHVILIAQLTFSRQMCISQRQIGNSYLNIPFYFILVSRGQTMYKMIFRECIFIEYSSSIIYVIGFVIEEAQQHSWLPGLDFSGLPEQYNVFLFVEVSISMCVSLSVKGPLLLPTPT